MSTFHFVEPKTIVHFVSQLSVLQEIDFYIMVD
jgi:hypothetical protein